MVAITHRACQWGEDGAVTDTGQQAEETGGLVGRGRLERVQTLQQFAGELAQLKAQSGLSVREAATSTRHEDSPVRRETVGKMMRGERIAPKAMTVTLVRAWGATEEDLPAWKQAWDRVFFTEGGLRMLPRPSEMTALRELVTRLQERLGTQEKELTALRGAISSEAASPRSGQDGPQNRPYGGGLAGMKAIALQMDLHDHMRGAVPEVAREAVIELAQRVRRQQIGLELEVRDQLTAQVPEVSKEIIRALAQQVADRNPQLKLELLDHMRAAVADAGRDVVTEMARHLT
jgi:hypothetical protein